MKIIDKKYIENNEEEIIREIRAGKVFIYPTDTIYGLGADATNDAAVSKIREIKKRETKPFSIIAPNLAWIEENCDVSSKEAKEALRELPGPVTLFLDRKNITCVSEEINPTDDSLGIRIPKHWFAKIISKAGVPFITTSVNEGGHSYMRRIEDVANNIFESVDHVVYEGEKINEPSKKIDLRKI